MTATEKDDPGKEDAIEVGPVLETNSPPEFNSSGKEDALEAGPVFENNSPPEFNSDDDLTVVDSASTAQDGVKRIEAVALSWSTTGLVVAYIGIFLLAAATSLEQNTTGALTVFATSSFQSHSLVSTVVVVQQVVNAVVKPPMAKAADVLGRLEAYCFAIFLYILGYIQMAASNNVKTFAAAQIFYSAGATGVQILQQVFIADTSDLLNRGLYSTLPDVPFLANVWIGPIIAQKLATKWRWGYGIWSIILPICFIPFATSLIVNQRKAKKKGLIKDKHEGEMTIARVGAGLRKFFYDIDTVGIILLSAGFGLILVPITIITKQKGGWENPSMITMLVIGPICLFAFPFWEAKKRFAPYPLVPLSMLKSRTVCCGCALGFFYFSAFYMSVFPYFNSYLLVVQNQSIAAAGHITQTFSFTATVSSLLTSIAMKYTRRYKHFVVAGTLIYIMGLGLMLRYRTDGSSIASIVGAQIAVGVGGGMLNVPAQIGVQASVSHQEVAAATAVFLVCIEIGGGVGAAVSGAIWTKMIPQRLALYLPEESKGAATEIFNSITVASNAYAVGTPERAAIDRAYQDTMRILLIIAICTSLPVLPLGLAMRNMKLDEIKQQVKGRVIGGKINSKGEKVHHGWNRMARIFGKKKEEEVLEAERAESSSPVSPPETPEIRLMPTQGVDAEK